MAAKEKGARGQFSPYIIFVIVGRKDPDGQPGHISA
jgi:hypothetical protein